MEYIDYIELAKKDGNTLKEILADKDDGFVRVVLSIEDVFVIPSHIFWLTITERHCVTF